MIERLSSAVGLASNQPVRPSVQLAASQQEPNVRVISSSHHLLLLYPRSAPLFQSSLIHIRYRLPLSPTPNTFPTSATSNQVYEGLLVHPSHCIADISTTHSPPSHPFPTPVSCSSLVPSRTILQLVLNLSTPPYFSRRLSMSL